MSEATFPNVDASLTGGLRERNQAARRDRVIRAAMDLASEGGYEAVHMRAVAERGDVALGTIYRYFSSKDDLLVSAMVQWAGQLRDRLADAPPSDDDPVDRVVAVLSQAVNALERRRGLTTALITAMSSTDPAVATGKVEIGRVMLETLQTAVGDSSEVSPSAVRVLGQVWFASLWEWVGGLADDGTVAADLAVATQLLLGSRVAPSS
ncbi:MAG: TetR family transcriptional regulator [Acidimicrobiia bacterium]|nr:TetR family transcriptional regulator [Acidimicrobiia bacterium]MBP8181907.1 TetR family transcriptional regulator [Acidimicrobiia bacterium]